MKVINTCLALYLISIPALAEHSPNMNTSIQDIEIMVENVLSDQPELILRVLENNPVLLANIVDSAVNIRNVKAEEQHWQDELDNPKIPVISTARPIRGARDAPITIVEYSDFECPYCQAAASTLHEILQEYEDSVRFIYKHNPLPFHTTAEPAARYFEAIALQDENQAWLFHDRVFGEQQQLGEDGQILLDIAASLNIDHDRLKKDLHSDVVSQRLMADVTEAQSFGFDGTPAFLINGVSVVGNQPKENFDRIINILLKRNI